jgi:preprotein translocase subunit SecE
MADAVAGNSQPSKSWWPRLVDFYNGVMVEMKKVTWPDLPQVRSATIAIIIFVLLIGLFITILDFALQGILIKAIPSLISGGR